MSEGVFIPQYVYGGQRRTSGTWFLPSTVGSRCHTQVARSERPVLFGDEHLSHQHCWFFFLVQMICPLLKVRVVKHPSSFGIDLCVWTWEGLPYEIGCFSFGSVYVCSCYIFLLSPWLSPYILTISVSFCSVWILVCFAGTTSTAAAGCLWFLFSCHILFSLSLSFCVSLLASHRWVLFVRFGGIYPVYM